jgi:hypothetical protein
MGAKVYYARNETNLTMAIYKLNNKQQIWYYNLHKQKKIPTVTSREIYDLPISPFSKPRALIPL